MNETPTGVAINNQNLTNMLTFEEIDALEYSWTAEVILNNGQSETIWHTAWWSSKRHIESITAIASDLPHYTIKKNTCNCSLNK